MQHVIAPHHRRSSFLGCENLVDLKLLGYTYCAKLDVMVYFRHGEKN